jgi:hypothetical protein
MIRALLIAMIMTLKKKKEPSKIFYREVKKVRERVFMDKKLLFCSFSTAWDLRDKIYPPNNLD